MFSISVHIESFEYMPSILADSYRSYTISFLVNLHAGSIVPEQVYTLYSVQGLAPPSDGLPNVFFVSWWKPDDCTKMW